ncbi:hypothetical protein [Nocardiopsis potens]|uniref:hypothetical protein n=1 Tax=Nocardiopsis potens TaxID=1246458 RepID=UPI001F4C9601|nr:hypothetical protein [Nocardiopsis potens]
MALVGAGVWAVVGLVGSDGFEKTPECPVVEGSVLDELVPEAEAEIGGRIDGLEQEGRDGVQCRWATGEDSAHTPSAVRVVMVRTGTEGGSAGEEASAELLNGASQRHERTALSGLGDEAYSWYDAEVAPLGWGCVGVRTANLYVETCYSSAADYGRTEPIPDADMVDGAKRLAGEVVAGIEESGG